MMPCEAGRMRLSGQHQQRGVTKSEKLVLFKS
jgi:hypothetical protein